MTKFNFQEQLLLNLDLASFLLHVRNQNGRLGRSIVNQNLSAGTLWILRHRNYLKVWSKGGEYFAKVTPVGMAFITEMRQLHHKYKRLWLGKNKKSDLIFGLAETFAFFWVQDNNLASKVVEASRKRQKAVVF